MRNPYRPGHQGPRTLRLHRRKLCDYKWLRGITDSGLVATNLVRQREPNRRPWESHEVVVFRIRNAARMAGLSPELIRAWERRYGLLAPERTGSGYRLYSAEDVEVLRGAKALIDGGQSIGEVSRLPRAELLAAAAQRVVPASVARPLNGESSVVGQQPTGEHPTADTQAVIAASLDAIRAFDRDALETALFPVVGVGTLSPTELCEQVLLPLLRAIGDAWEAGHLSIGAEHFGSALIRGKIAQLIEHQPRGPRTRRVVCACPPGESHEGGLLAFAVHAVASDWRVIYLGANTPVSDIFQVAERTDAHAVALSVTLPLPTETAADVVTAAANFRHAHPQVPVLVGGAAAAALNEHLSAAGVRVAAHIALDLADLGGPA